MSPDCVLFIEGFFSGGSFEDNVRVHQKLESFREFIYVVDELHNLNNVVCLFDIVPEGLFLEFWWFDFVIVSFLFLIG
jgi:hypothetical protein